MIRLLLDLSEQPVKTVNPLRPTDKCVTHPNVACCTVLWDHNSWAVNMRYTAAARTLSTTGHHPPSSMFNDTPHESCNLQDRQQTLPTSLTCSRPCSCWFSCRRSVLLPASFVNLFLLNMIVNIRQQCCSMPFSCVVLVAGLHLSRAACAYQCALLQLHPIYITLPHGADSAHTCNNACGQQCVATHLV